MKRKFKDYDTWLFEKQKIYNLEDVQKVQSKDFSSSDIIFDTKPNDKFILTKVNINDIIEKHESLSLDQYKDDDLDEDIHIVASLIDSIVNEKDITPIVIDENNKILDGLHRFVAYRELYEHYGYDFPWDGSLPVYKRIKEERSMNEDYKEGSIWRNTSEEWLQQFLSKGKIKHVDVNKKLTFISFSRDSESGGQDIYGDINIEFNEDVIFNQDLIEIYYEPEFMEMYPEICMYITGYDNEQDYYEDKDLSGKDEAWEEFELDWETHIEDFQGEEEILMKELKFQPNLIKNVKFSKLPEEKTINLLKRYKINYELKKSNKNYEISKS